VSKTIQHLVVLDLYHEGHHRSYIEMFVDGWLQQESSGTLSILVTERFQLEHVEWIRRLESADNQRVSIVMLAATQPSGEKKGVFKFLEINRSQKQALEQACLLAPDHILCMYLDHAQGAIRSLSKIPQYQNIQFSGILFRATLHLPVGSFKEKLTRFRKRAVLKSLLSTRSLKHVFCLDPDATESINALTEGSKAISLPDGTLIHPSNSSREQTRAAWGVSEEDHVVLQFGVQSERKGIYQVLEAFQAINQKSWVLVIAGKPTESEDEAIRVAIEAAGRSVRIIWEAQFFSEGEMTAYFEASDVILAAYPNHVGSSGILVRAAAARKPVLGSESGLVGRNIERHTLGMRVDCNDSNAIKTGLLQLAEKPHTYFDDVAASNFAGLNTPEEFARVLLEGLYTVDGGLLGP